MWAQGRHNWNLCRVIWSDESRHTRYVVGGRQWVRRSLKVKLLPQNALPTMADGDAQCECKQPSRMVYVKVARETMNDKKYERDIIQNTLMSFIHALPHVAYIFQVDNTRLHHS